MNHSQLDKMADLARDDVRAECIRQSAFCDGEFWPSPQIEREALETAIRLVPYANTPADFRAARAAAEAEYYRLRDDDDARDALMARAKRDAVEF